MKKTVVLAGVVLSVSAGFAAAACSSGTNTDIAPGAANANSGATNANTAVVSSTGGGHSTSTDDEIPATVKAVFPEAQSFTKQHKDIPANAIAEMEKETGGKVPDKDHHSYLAFSTTGGARKQVGAATIVKATGKDMVVVYENKGGSPYIKEVRGEGVPEPFLAQFAGKGHDDKFQVGLEIKATGVDEATAKSIAQAIRIDAMTMQTLFGASHSH